MTSISGTVATTPETKSETSATISIGYGAVITMAFAIVVAMWSLGFFARLPVGGGGGAGSVLIPSQLVAFMIAAVMIAGGYLGRRWSGGGLWFGAQVGFVAGLVNLLIIAGVIMKPSAGGTMLAAAVWIPGSIFGTTVLTTMGAALAGQRSGTVEPVNWVGLFAKIAATATFVLLMVGGAVTAQDAGLAVVDWPNTEGYLMWAFPLAKMTGGIYYEHSHRLFGTLVGLCTVILAVYLQLRDSRVWLKRLAWIAVVLVIGQGILGGLRVTGHLTLSADADVTRPSLTLAVVHGVLGQVFFSVMVALWVFTSRRWQAALETIGSPSAATDRSVADVLYVALVVQLVLGALVRHLLSDAQHVASGNVNVLLAFHITMAVIVFLMATYVGVRVIEKYLSAEPLGQLGIAILGLITFQLVLGCIAYVVLFIGDPQPRPATGLDAIFTTMHQSVGALLLAAVMMHVLWSRRLLTQAEHRTAPLNAGAPSQ